VLDTNVVLDWLVFADAAAVPLAEALQAGTARWLATPAMRLELAHMLAHASLQAWKPDSEQLLSIFDASAELRPEPPPSRLRCTDPDDQVFIDLALAAGARWLVTRDKALLRLHRRAGLVGLTICHPAAWRPAQTTDFP